MRNPFPNPRRRLSLPLSLLAAVLLAGGITLLALWCQPNSFRGLLSGFLRQPLLIVLNALPVGLLLLAAAALLRNVFFGAALVNLAVCALSIANRVKIEVRDEPVFPRDFALLKEVGSALESYDIHYPAAQIAAVVLATAALLALGVFLGCKPFPVERLRGWGGSLLGAVASLAVLTGLVLTVYASKGLYQSFKVSNAEYVPAVFNDLGFPYAFCHHFTTYLVDRPEGFSRAGAEEWETGDRTGLGKDVSVIMVMNEAFSDITDAPAFPYTEENDPLPNLHALRRDPHALSGHVVVPGFAGGTANTEFDVLTGMQTNALSASTTSAMRAVNRNLDSLFRVFGNDGYETAFCHPGDNWFYNRENVYRWFGAEESLFIGDMEAPEYKGRWVTDDYTADLIERAFEKARAPLFHFTTTILHRRQVRPGLPLPAHRRLRPLGGGGDPSERLRGGRPGRGRHAGPPLEVLRCAVRAGGPGLLGGPPALPGERHAGLQGDWRRRGPRPRRPGESGGLQNPLRSLGQ